MKKFLPWSLSILLLLISALGNAVPITVASSTFDTGLDGWTAIACDGTNCPAVSAGSGTFSWAAAGGNPGGYIDFDDGPDITQVFAVAPTAFIGDLSALNGVGELSFDFLNLGGGDLGLSVFLTGGGGANQARFDFVAGGINTGWQSYAVAIDESMWTVTSGDWNSLLASVGSLIIPVDKLNDLATDRNGLDNVLLSITSVPEPGTLALFGIGLAGIGLARRRRKA